MDGTCGYSSQKRISPPLSTTTITAATHIQFYAKHLHMWSREIRIWVSCEISGKLKPARNTWLNSQKIGSGFYYFSNSTHFTSHYTWQTEQVFTLVIKRNVAFGLISPFINSNQNQWGGNWMITLPQIKIIAISLCFVNFLERAQMLSDNITDTKTV